MPEARRLSSEKTLYYKKGYPLLFTGFAAIISISMIMENPLCIFFAPLMLIFSYKLSRMFSFDLMDEVYDAGYELIVKNNGGEENIPLSDISSVRYFLTRPKRITLDLKNPSKFGNKISFSPAVWQPGYISMTNSIAEDLKQRIQR